MNAEKLQSLLLYRYRYAIAYAVLLLTGVGTLVYKIGDLLPGLSPSETDQGLTITQDSTTILEQGLYLPYSIVQAISIGILGESALALRIPSLIFGFLILVMMYVLIHLWHKEKIAIISILFLATSSWYLTFARIGTPYIYLAFCVVLIFMAGTLLRHAEHKRLGLVVAAFSLPLTLYAPFMVYMLLLFVLLYRKEFLGIIQRMQRSNLVIVCMVGFSALIPLIYSFVSNPETIKMWLGIADGLPSVSEFFKNMLASVQHVLWSSENNPEFHLGDIAMLDIFTATMAALGLYHYEQHFNWLRTRFIIYGLGVMLVIFGLTTDEGVYFMAAPIIYILAATGIITLLNQWNRIFPYNPFARTLALLPLALALLVTSQYHLDRHFSAWAYSPTTRAIYAIEPTLLESAIEASSPSVGRILIITRESEHRTLEFLLNDASVGRSIDVVTPEEGNRQTNFASRYDVVYLDGDVSGDLKKRLDAYISETISNDRESRPIAYRLYDLNTKVGYQQ